MAALNWCMGKFPLDDRQEGSYCDASVKKRDHLLDTKSRLFACKDELEYAGCECWRCHVRPTG